MILRLQSEQELELLQSRIKAKSKAINVHESELRTNTGTDMTRLDYDALWHRAKEEAAQRVEKMYPPEAARKRAEAEIAISQKLYHQFTTPPFTLTPKQFLARLDERRIRLRAAHKGPRATFEHQLLGRQLTQSGISYKEEFRFEPKRRWKADFYIPKGNFLVEIVGGLWLQRSGHSHGKAQLDDMEKFNHAAKLGFRVLQFSPDQVKSGEAVGFIGGC